MKQRSRSSLLILTLSFTVVGCSKMPRVSAPTIAVAPLDGATGRTRRILSEKLPRSSPARRKSTRLQDKGAIYGTIVGLYSSLFLTPGSVDETALGQYLDTPLRKRTRGAALDRLSLKKLGRQIDRVTSDIITVDPIAIYYDARGRASAVAGVNFVMHFVTDSGTAAVLRSHGNIYLSKRGRVWQVIDYDLEQNASNVGNGKR